jgi:hypothetical protein
MARIILTLFGSDGTCVLANEMQLEPKLHSLLSSISQHCLRLLCINLHE